MKREREKEKGMKKTVAVVALSTLLFSVEAQ